MEMTLGEKSILTISRYDRHRCPLLVHRTARCLPKLRVSDADIFHPVITVMVQGKLMPDAPLRINAISLLLPELGGVCA